MWLVTRISGEGQHEMRLPALRPALQLGAYSRITNRDEAHRRPARQLACPASTLWLAHMQPA